MRSSLFLSITAASITLLAGTTPKTKVQPPTVESVKAMSMFDLVNDVSDTESLMLENAHDSVSGTISALLRIHQKRISILQGEVRYTQEALSQTMSRPLNYDFGAGILNTQEFQDKYIKNKQDAEYRFTTILWLSQTQRI